MGRPGSHPIAWTRCPVDFGPGDVATRAPMRISLHRQQKRVTDWRKAHKATGPGGLGLWVMPHAVSLADPFATACGTAYSAGVEVPQAYHQDGHLVASFEALHIGQKCRGCAGSIGADSTV